MQHAASMSDMSPAENLFGRVAQKGKKFRLGQRALIQYVSDNPDQPIYNGVLPTGYGKSLTALGICDVIKQQGRANRFLFIVPTDTQRTQYAEDIGEAIADHDLNLLVMEDFSKNERKVKLMPVIVDGTVKVLRAHRENRSEIYITTVQSICAGDGFYRDLMSNGSWCVFCDEYQKLNTDEAAKWGAAVGNLNRTVMFGLTATPIRSDRKLTVFGNKSPDIEVSLEEAYKEEAIRGVKAHIEHYFIDVETDDGVERITTENVEDFEISKDLRIHTKYLASILFSAHACLLSKNSAHHNQHQMLVFAMNCSHARQVSDVMNAVFGSGFSDWVGVGPNGRADNDNRDIITAYKDNKLKCLVQVDLAGEGFNNPRSSVLVFLNLLKKATVKAVQQAGRGLRRNYKINSFAEDVCDIFASPDTEMAELAKELAERTLDTSDIGSDKINGDSQKERAVPVYSIPSFDNLIHDIEFQKSEIISKITPEQREDARIRLIDAGGLSKIEVDSISDERLDDAIARWMTANLNKEINTNQSNEEKVKDAQKILVSNVMRVHYGPSVQKNVGGDLHKAINKAWKRRSGMGHAAMFEEDFRKKHDWLQSINEEIKATREVPKWLQL